MAATSTSPGPSGGTAGSSSRPQGRYVLRDLLGRGGMGEVFSGYVLGSHGFQKPVAIKRLLPELANDQVLVNRLIGEAKLLVGMHHGNIVSVLDLARDGGDVFLVMEFVDGPSLAQLIKGLEKRGQARLSFAIATYIIQSAAAGLAYAHSRPGGAVIHADVSPSNLLLTTSGEVRVADFGIARREGRTDGLVEGKWAYMAPEQQRGEELTPRSDVFALGVVLYELITGKHPLAHMVDGKRDSGPLGIVSPRVINPLVPSGLDAACMRALAEDPRDRYADMQQFSEALVDERFVHGWREAAHDLARVITTIAPDASGDQPHTHVTGRPVTILTRSLISRPQLPPSPPDPADVGDMTGTCTSLLEVPRAEDFTGAFTALVEPPQAGSGRSFAVGTVPPPVLAPSTGAYPAVAAVAIGEHELRRLSASLLPHADLSAVHGGAAETMLLRLPRRSPAPIYSAVFVVAAFAGVIAAVASSGPSLPETVEPTRAAIAPSADPEPTTPSEPTSPPSDHQAPAVDMASSIAMAAVDAAVPPGDVAATAIDIAPATADTAPTVPEPTPTVPEPAPTVPEPAPAPAITTDVGRPSHAKAPGKRPIASRTRKAPRKVPEGMATLRINQLNVDAPWVSASVNGTRRDVPSKFQLPPGRYTVKLSNADLGLSTSCGVVLARDEVVTINVDIERKRCDRAGPKE